MGGISAEIRRLKARIEDLKKHGERSGQGWSFDGGRVEAKIEANRLQIIFDDIPEAEIRTQLLSNGFR